MEFISAIPPQFHSIALLVVVMLAKYILERLSPHQPWQFFSFFCQQLAAKVNKEENGAKQQFISGVVAVLVTFTPLWVILWLFGGFIEVAFLWQSLLLYLALGPLTFKHSANSIIKSIDSGDKYQAKQTLQKLALRETSSLSVMGLSKASIEMLVLKPLQQTITVSILFLIGGGLLAISYRLILEMHYAWNQKLYKMRSFGRFANAVTQIFTWLPSRMILIGGLFLSFGQQSRLLWRLTMPHFFKLDNNALMQFFALALNVRLGGVAMYNGAKLRREEFNSKGKQPELQDIRQCYRFLDRINYLIIILIFAYFILVWAATNTA